MAAVACCLAAGVAKITVSSYRPYDRLSSLADRSEGGENPDLQRGRIAYQRGDFVAAQQDLRRALTQLTAVRDRRAAQTLLAASAFRSGNFRTTIATLEGRDRSQEDCEHLLLLAAAYVEGAEIEKGMALFALTRERFPDDPAPLYWEARYKFLHGHVDGAWVTAVAERLRSYASPKSVHLSRSLQELIKPAPGMRRHAAPDPSLLHAASTHR
jgi:hypothetical protein